MRIPILILTLAATAALLIAALPTTAGPPADGETAAPAAPAAPVDEPATDEAPSAADTARDYFEKMSSVDFRALSAEWMPKLSAARQEGDAEKLAKLQAEYRAAMAVVRAKRAELQAKFVDAFMEAGPDAFNAEAEQGLLVEGLMGAGRELTDDDPAGALKHYMMIVEKFPDSRNASTVQMYYMPALMPLVMDMDKAKAKLAALVETAPATAKTGLVMWQGDYEAMTGHVDKARTFWQQIADGDDARQKRYADLRLATVGKPMMEIDAQAWFGPMRDLTGKVVMIDFWATWCGPCIGSIPHLQHMYEEHAEDGFEILAVTRHYANGYEAASMDELAEGRREGESKRGMDLPTFHTHLAAFRANTGVSYPFVVGTPQDFSNYRISGIPSMFVVDRNGTICFAVVGGGKHKLLEKVIARCLAEEPKAEAAVEPAE
jgi:thiol-disulfide isomerase/thioredoxin